MDSRFDMQAEMERQSHGMTSFLMRMFANELKLAHLAGRLSGDSLQEQYLCFLAGAGDPKYQAYLEQKYPVCYAQLDASVAGALNLHVEVHAAYREDRRALTSVLSVDIDDEVVDVVPVGDPHDNWRRAARVELRSGTSIYYKPRLPTGELAISSILQSLQSRSAVSTRMAVPLILQGNSHHWQSSVSTPPTPVADDWEALGGWLALCYFTSSTDMHFENLVASSSAVYGVDLECAFTPRVSIAGDAQRADSVEYDLLSTSMLPMRLQWAQGNGAYNYGAIGGQVGDGLPASMEMDGYGTPMPSFRSIPTAPDKVAERDAAVLLIPHIEELWAGYLEVANALASIHEEDSHWLRDIKASHDPRVVMRATQTYVDILNKLSHPAAFVSFGVFTEMAREALSPHHRAVSPRVLQHEIDSLAMRNIPLFTESSLALLQGDGEGYAFDNALDSAESRLAGWSRAEMSTRVRLFIEAHFRAYIEQAVAEVPYISDESMSPSTSAATSTSASHGSNVKRILTSSLEDISSAAFDYEGKVSWYGTARIAGGSWSAQHAGSSMYSGTAGILLGLTEGALALDAPHLMALPRRLARDLLETDLDSMTPGAFSGIASVAYGIGYALTRELVSQDEAKRALRRLTAVLLESANDTSEWDLISGVAGVPQVAQALLSNQLLSREDAHAWATATSSTLLRLASPSDRGRVWGSDGTWLGGLSHGQAGVAWGAGSVLALGVVDQETVDLRNEAAMSQSSLRVGDYAWSDKRPAEQRAGEVSNTWCHGAEGILMSAALGVQGIVSSTRPSDLKAAFRSLPVTYDLTLCHGKAARVLTERLVFQTTDSADLQSPGELIAAIVGADQGESLMDYSLMTGKAGPLFALASSITSCSANPLALRL